MLLGDALILMLLYLFIFLPQNVVLRHPDYKLGACFLHLSDSSIILSPWLKKKKRDSSQIILISSCNINAAGALLINH